MNADTSSQPQGITRRMMLSVLEAFFRRPVLHLLPLVLFIALGASLAFRGDQVYSTAGTLSVTNESLLADLTESAQSGGLGFETAAAVTADQINELLRTDEFLDNVSTLAGVDTLVESGALTRQNIRGWVGAASDGDNIVRVGARTPDPELSLRLSDATIDAYRDWVIDSDIAQSTSTEASLQARVAEKQQVADQADEAVRQKILENPEVEIEDRALVDQLEYQRLQDEANRAHDQLLQAQDSLDAAALQTDQASAIVAQRIKLLDEPELPSLAEGRLKKAALTLVVFGVVGSILSLASVVLASSLDHTIRVPNDVTSRFGVDVLAVLPDVSR